jgi:hypothetical protein
LRVCADLFERVNTYYTKKISVTKKNPEIHCSQPQKPMYGFIHVKGWESLRWLTQKIEEDECRIMPFISKSWTIYRGWARRNLARKSHGWTRKEKSMRWEWQERKNTSRVNKRKEKENRQEKTRYGQMTP